MWYRAEQAQRRFRAPVVVVTCRPTTYACPTTFAMIRTHWAVSSTQVPARIQHTARRSVRGTAVSNTFPPISRSTHNNLSKPSPLAQYPYRGYSLTSQPHIDNRSDKDQLDVIYGSNDKIWRYCSTNSNGDSNFSHSTDKTFNGLPLLVEVLNEDSAVKRMSNVFQSLDIRRLGTESLRR